MSILAFPAPESCQAESVEPEFLRVGEPRGGAVAIRRRGTQDQGRALEALGHAVEYLVDSRLFDLGERNVRDEHEAIQIMMRMSRAIFSECSEVVSIRKRMRRWIVERFSSRSGFAGLG